jgi:hypothetical protein
MAIPPILCGAHRYHDELSGADDTMGNESNWTGQYHPLFGYVYGDGQNIFQQIQNDEHEPKQAKICTGPFAIVESGHSVNF